MRRFLTHADGRLKSGRIAFLLFVGLIVCFSLAYRFARPVDRVMVAVTHMFNAQPVKTAPEAARPQEKPAKPVEAKPAAPELRQERSGPPVENKPAKRESGEQAVPRTGESLDKGKMDKGKNRSRPASAKKPANITTAPAAPPGTVLSEKEKTDEGVSLTLEGKAYESIYRQWREAGGNNRGALSLRIENLREVYPLLQMKAVATLNGKPYVDLSDGSRVAEGALESYSSTRFLVSDPFEKWPDALARAGLVPSMRVEVWYYTYDFIRNAIYGRAWQAIDCAIQGGLIPAETDPASMDLLGRAYAVKRKGGGGFAVFVPIRVDLPGDLPGGRTVRIDPSCFAGNGDVAALIAAGILR
ncbi:MAG: hypothetical protein GXP53_06655 [Deltaproteobacteria bacterium]|nr:hypothetical protein [Deltaproteobacteria bacterium]